MRKNFFASLFLSFFLVFPFYGIEAQENAGGEEVDVPDSLNRNFHIAKNLDIFNALFKELNMFYVDTLNVDKTMETGINGMLGSLDPYTVYYPQNKISDLNFLTTGEYAGIGALITQKDGKVIITDPYEGTPAAKTDLRPGDVILAIDGIDLKEKTSAFASNKLKGEPNTIVKIKYIRPGEKKPKEISVEREKIHMDPITYYGTFKNNVGYICLNQFTTDCSQSFKDAFMDLKQNKHITSLVLDLRNNGGGVVEEALQILNMFLPKGKVLLTTKSKLRQLDRTYRATHEPVDTVMPIAVLVNEGTASASEIVSGTLQDLDRAVVVGTRTFGKGLVQMPRDLPYNTRMKVTISKYYIPSGRCIQAIDYSHRSADGRVYRTPDSLTHVFYTSLGRPVRDGGGIRPDFVVKEDVQPTMFTYLEMELLPMEFVSEWRIKHPKIASPSDFVFTDDIYKEFGDFLKKNRFTYDRQSEAVMKTLKQVMNFEGYDKTASSEYQALADKLKPDLNRDLNVYQSGLSKLLAKEIMKDYYFSKGELIYSLKNDPCMDRAIGVLGDVKAYRETLSSTFKDLAKKEVSSEEVSPEDE